MIHYAELNENNVCIGVKTVKDEITENNHIQIPTADFEHYSWRKYEDEQWSTEKYVPDYGQIELDRMEGLEESQADQDEVIMQILLGGM